MTSTLPPAHGSSNQATTVNSTANHSSPTEPQTLQINNASTGEVTSNEITVDFEGGTHVIIRPNRIIRVTRIRIKFRAEEVACVRVDEGNGDGRGTERIHKAITTFFETDWKLWGYEASPFSQSAWDDLEAGRYEFPFALKFPNVNYPPSMEEPQGFSIRYIWTAQIDGPALQSGLKSREYITPYRPIIVSTPDKEWNYRTSLTRYKKQSFCEVQAKLQKQSYCPDEPFSMDLKLTMLNSDNRITAVTYRFRKHHEGKMLVNTGTAFCEHVRTVLQGMVPVQDGSQVNETVQFNVPTRLVSPSFASRHTRVHYDLQFFVAVEIGGLFKSTHTSEFFVPLTIANLPHNQLLRIPNLTTIQCYQNNKECPLFFDPSLDEPPAQQGLPSELIGPLTAALMSTPGEDPPNYFSLPQLPPQFEIRKERKERTVYLSRSAKGGPINEAGDAVIVPSLFDEEW
ncbi:uncharacterized protein BYT42DRAFT_502081 [Radiomyces spectabilis]|uniref:uncharacterized protein n=1 Tax=Radiomyces spectabilis TaxID=64574 RepID=UPI00221FF5F6|nr:uncharacterized protein BYT42DRAFT_502081 [Radiomyces spectabilis]KAI8370314.1 hypothetical protein BYT42DRAFT_502081 [Radiomyces spectabilis]